MKKLRSLLVLILLFSAVPYAQAQTLVQPEKYCFGADFAVKVDYLHFMDSNAGRINADNGTFIGAEFYKQLFFPNFFLGIESGWGEANGKYFGFDTEFTYVPIELNAKYEIPLAQHLALSLGAGISGNWAQIDLSIAGHEDQWLFGGQFFAEINYKFRNCYFGLNVKYKLTEEKQFFLVPFAADNLTTGGQIGLLF